MENLLFLAHRIPYPPNKGDKVRSYNLLKHLTRHYRVYLGAFVDDPEDFRHEGTLKALCGDCRLVRLDPASARLHSLRGLFSGEALTLPYYRSEEMQRWVDETISAQRISKVLIFSAAMAQYVMSERRLTRVADLVDVDSDKWRQYAATRWWPYSMIFRRESAKLLEYERLIAKRFNATVFVSPAEAELFRRLAPESMAKVFHANNGVDSDFFSPDSAGANPYRDASKVIVFTGAMDYWPNVDAVVAFAQGTFAKIREVEPDAVFYIVGARPTSQVLRLGELPGVKVTGAVSDIRPYIAHATLAVAPLRIARGVQNKVLEAMAMGKIVIASPQAAEGIDAAEGKEFLVAANDDAWVNSVVRVLRRNAPAGLGDAARERVRKSYDWGLNLDKFGDWLEKGAGPASGAAGVWTKEPSNAPAVIAGSN